MALLELWEFIFDSKTLRNWFQNLHNLGPIYIYIYIRWLHYRKTQELWKGPLSHLSCCKGQSCCCWFLHFARRVFWRFESFLCSTGLRLFFRVVIPFTCLMTFWCSQPKHTACVCSCHIDIDSLGPLKHSNIWKLYTVKTICGNFIDSVPSIWF